MNKNGYLGILIVLIILAALYFMWPKSPSKLDSLSNNNYSTTTSATTSTNIISTTTPKTDTITNNTTKNNKMHKVTIETSKGTIVFETYDADAPKTVENFITLANKNFYNGLTFHRIIKGFMIQGGDPMGNGTGGPGYTFEDELNPNTESYKIGYKRGVVAMANAGPNTNGSQFFIMHKDTPLPHKYSIFGNVISGMEVVDEIVTTQTDAFDAPLQKIVMNKVKVENVK